MQPKKESHRDKIKKLESENIRLKENLETQTLRDMFAMSTIHAMRQRFEHKAPHNKIAEDVFNFVDVLMEERKTRYFPNTLTDEELQKAVNKRD